MSKSVLYYNKEKCCGCEACVSICPKGIISLSQDDEGFSYPSIIDKDACIDCKRCESVCPTKHVEEISSKFNESYAGWAKNNSDIIESSSGGFATILAKRFIVNGGVVYGVSYSSDYDFAEYIRADTVEKVLLLRTSKYIQARKNSIYNSIRRDLKTKKVLFIGTPCDVYAIDRITNSDKNLYTVAIICHGPTNEIIHQKFLSCVRKNTVSKVESFSVRYKKDGKWKPYYIFAKFSDGYKYLRKFKNTDYNTGFLYFKRPSCGVCQFKNNHFSSDVLIGDYHNAKKGRPSWNKSGVSSIFPLTSKGQELFESIKDMFVYHKVPTDTAILQQAIHSPVKKHIDRVQFVDELNNRGLHYACRIQSIKKEKRCSRIRKTRIILLHIWRRVCSIAKIK